MKASLFLTFVSLCLVTAGAGAVDFPDAPVGVDMVMNRLSCTTSGTFDLLRDLGVQSVRVHIRWEDFAVVDSLGNATIDTTALADCTGLLNALNDNGIHVYGNLYNAVGTASPAILSDPNYYGTTTFQNAFKAFTLAVIGGTKDKGCTWELWNEPNYGNGCWPGNSTDQYMQLANTVAPAIRSADPSATIIGPGTTVSPTTYASVDMDYLTACFNYGNTHPGQQGLLSLVDGVSIHPYRASMPETVVSDYSALRTVMNQYGGSGVKIVCGEWGYAAPCPNFWGVNVTAQMQADYLGRELLTNISQGIPLSSYFCFEHYVETNPTTGDSADLGLFYDDAGNLPKPAYYAMKILTHTLAGATYVNGEVGTNYTNNWGVFATQGDSGSNLTMAAWNTTSGPSQMVSSDWGTLLLNGTPLYVGQQLAWQGGANNNWSNTTAWGGKPWRVGCQAKLNNADTQITVDGQYTISGLQIGANNIGLDGGTLRFTSGGGNIYVANGFSYIGSVIADATDRRQGDKPITYANTPETFVLRKCGGGKLNLLGNNTFHGGILVGEGFLQTNHDHALGDSANPLTLAGGGIDFNGYSPTTGSLSIAVAGSALGNYRANTFSRYTFAPGTIGTDFTVAGAGDLDLSGQLASDHSITLTKNDSGALTLSGDGDNSYLDLVVNTGTVQLNKQYSDTAHAANKVTVNGGATVKYMGAESHQIWGAITLNGGTLDFNGHDQTGTNTMTVSTPDSTIANTAAGTASAFSLSRIYMNQNMTVNAVGDLTINGRISYTTNLGSPTPTCMLTKTGAGLLTLNSGTFYSNRYRGGTTIDEGNLLFATTTSQPTTGLTLIKAGGALVAAGAHATVAEWLNPSLGRISTSSSGALALAADNSETINLSTGGYAGLSIGSTGNYTYSGTLTPADNTYRLGGGGGTITIASPLANGTTHRSLIVSGNVALTGANTYSGETTINNGVLRIAAEGSLNASSNGITLNGGTLLVNSTAPLIRSITVNGGTLGGTGQHVGTLSIGEGHLSPGDGGLGTMSQQGNLTLDAGAVLDFDLGTTPGVSDHWAFDGAGCNLILDGTLNIAASGPVAAGDYVLFSGATSVVDNGLDFGDMPMTHQWSYAIRPNGGYYDVVLTAAPEPSARVIAVTALVGLGGWKLRKRR